MSVTAYPRDESARKFTLEQAKSLRDRARQGDAMAARMLAVVMFHVFQLAGKPRTAVLRVVGNALRQAPGEVVYSGLRTASALANARRRGAGA